MGNVFGVIGRTLLYIGILIYYQDEEDEGIDEENAGILDKLKQTQRQDYLRGSVSGSVQATDR